MKSVAKEYTSMKCKEKEDLIEIRVSVKLFFFKTFLDALASLGSMLESD